MVMVINLVFFTGRRGHNVSGDQTSSLPTTILSLLFSGRSHPNYPASQPGAIAPRLPVCPSRRPLPVAALVQSQGGRTNVHVERAPAGSCPAQNLVEPRSSLWRPPPLRFVYLARLKAGVIQRAVNPAL